MADNEFLRQKREREFQQRVLAALEKPKSHRIIRVINAPFFLWLLTVILVTGGRFLSKGPFINKSVNSSFGEVTFFGLARSCNSSRHGTSGARG